MREKDDHNVEVVKAEVEVDKIAKSTKIIRTKAVDKLFAGQGIIYSSDRDDRVSNTGEIFTPFELIEKMLSELDYDFSNHDHTKNWCDPTCGTANFLVMLAALGVQPKNIYGVDLMQDNVDISHQRLKDIFLEQGYEESEIDFHLNRNVVQGDALTYSYSFHEEDKMDEW